MDPSFIVQIMDLASEQGEEEAGQGQGRAPRARRGGDRHRGRRLGVSEALVAAWSERY